MTHPSVSSPTSNQSHLLTLKTLQWLPISLKGKGTAFSKSQVVLLSADSLTSLPTLPLTHSAPATLASELPLRSTRHAPLAFALWLPLCRNSLAQISTLLAPSLPSGLSQTSPSGKGLDDMQLHTPYSPQPDFPPEHPSPPEAVFICVSSSLTRKGRQGQGFVLFPDRVPVSRSTK